MYSVISGKFFKALTEILYKAKGDPASELPSGNHIAVLIGHLRRKIGDKEWQLILHLRGEGYFIP